MADFSASANGKYGCVVNDAHGNRTGRVTVVVRTAAGGSAGECVIVTSPAVESSEIEHRTGPDGTAGFGLAPAVYTIQAFGETEAGRMLFGQATDVTVAAGDTSTVDITVTDSRHDRWGTVTGTVRTSAGVPMGGCHVSPNPETNPAEGLPEPAHFTDPGGVYRFGLPVARYTIEAHGETTTGRVPGVIITAGQTTVVDITVTE